MKPFKILSRRIILDEPYFCVEAQRVQFPDETEGDWYIKLNRDAVIVIPMDKDKRVLLQRCYKHGGGEIVTEFCAGLIDDGEDPETAAHRELEEETGMKAEKLEKIGTCLASPTSTNMKYHFFIAHNCTAIGKQNLEAAEQIEPFWVENLAAAKKILNDPKTQKGSSSLAAINFVI